MGSSIPIFITPDYNHIVYINLLSEHRKCLFAQTCYFKYVLALMWLQLYFHGLNFGLSTLTQLPLETLIHTQLHPYLTPDIHVKVNRYSSAHMYVYKLRWASSSAYRVLIMDLDIHSSMDFQLRQLTSMLIYGYNHCHVDFGPKLLAHIQMHMVPIWITPMCVFDSNSICLLACAEFSSNSLLIWFLSQSVCTCIVQVMFKHIV